MDGLSRNFACSFKSELCGLQMGVLFSQQCGSYITVPVSSCIDKAFRCCVKPVSAKTHRFNFSHNIYGLKQDLTIFGCFNKKDYMGT